MFTDLMDRPGIDPYRPLAAEDANSGLRILLVSDDPWSVGQVARWLRVCGHRVAVTANGPSALARLVSCPPDVVLLLSDLPTSELAEQLRDPYPVSAKRPFVIALAREGEKYQWSDLRADLLLEGPPDPSLLWRVLWRFERILHPSAAQTPPPIGRAMSGFPGNRVWLRLGSFE